MAEKEYIEREAVNALIEAECSPKVAAFLNHAIDDIHAADVRPVRRGTWEAHEAYIGAAWCFWECSVCGDKSWTIKHNFCPNCGADMREPPKEE